MVVKCTSKCFLITIWNKPCFQISALQWSLLHSKLILYSVHCFSYFVPLPFCQIFLYSRDHMNVYRYTCILTRFHIHVSFNSHMRSWLSFYTLILHLDLKCLLLSFRTNIALCLNKMDFKKESLKIMEAENYTSLGLIRHLMSKSKQEVLRSFPPILCPIWKVSASSKNDFSRSRKQTLP